MRALDKPSATVLLVDDDATTNFLHRRAIRKSPHRVEVVDVLDGESGIDRLRSMLASGQPVPTLIFLDINMPRMDGWAFLEAFRTLPVEWRAGSRVYMLTTSLDPDEHARARAYAEVSDVLDKMMDTPTFTRVFEGGGTAVA